MPSHYRSSRAVTSSGLTSLASSCRAVVRLAVPLGMMAAAQLGCKEEPLPYETHCADEVDNDGDGAEDGADAECQGGEPEVGDACSDGIDNNDNGLTDCEEPECLPQCTSYTFDFTGSAVTMTSPPYPSQFEQESIQANSQGCANLPYGPFCGYVLSQLVQGTYGQNCMLCTPDTWHFIDGMWVDGMGGGGPVNCTPYEDLEDFSDPQDGPWTPLPGQSLYYCEALVPPSPFVVNRNYALQFQVPSGDSPDGDLAMFVPSVFLFSAFSGGSKKVEPIDGLSPDLSQFPLSRIAVTRTPSEGSDFGVYLQHFPTEVDGGETYSGYVVVVNEGTSGGQVVVQGVLPDHVQFSSDLSDEGIIHDGAPQGGTFQISLDIAPTTTARVFRLAVTAGAVSEPLDVAQISVQLTPADDDVDNNSDAVSTTIADLIDVQASISSTQYPLIEDRQYELTLLLENLIETFPADVDYTIPIPAEVTLVSASEGQFDGEQVAGSLSDLTPSGHAITLSLRPNLGTAGTSVFHSVTVTPTDPIQVDTDEDNNTAVFEIGVLASTAGFPTPIATEQTIKNHIGIDLPSAHPPGQPNTLIVDIKRPSPPAGQHVFNWTAMFDEITGLTVGQTMYAYPPPEQAVIQAPRRVVAQGDLMTIGAQVEPLINISPKCSMRELEVYFDARAATSNRELIGKATLDQELVILTPVAVQGDPVPGTGTFYGAPIEQPQVTSAGRVYWLADTTLGTTIDQLILFSDDGGQTIGTFAQEGITVPGQQAGGATLPWDNFDTDNGLIQRTGLFVSADESTVLLRGDLEGTALTDDILTVNNNVVIQEGHPLDPMFTSPVNGVIFGNLYVAANGDWFARGENGDGIQWVVRNGALVAFEAGELFPGAGEFWTDFKWAVGEPDGRYAICGATDLHSRGIVVVYPPAADPRIVSRQDDPIDFSENGLFDNDTFISNYPDDGAIMHAGGALTFLVDVKPFAGSTIGQALVQLNADQPPVPGDLDGDGDPELEPGPSEKPRAEWTDDDHYNEAKRKYGQTPHEKMKKHFEAREKLPVVREKTWLERMYEEGPRDPVYLFSGEYYCSHDDMHISGRGPGFVWSRKYRSRFGPDTEMGNGWDYTYNIFIEQAGLDVRLHDGNSRSDLYLPQPNGTWTTAEFFRELAENPDGTYTLTFAHSVRWNFHAFVGSPQDGKLSSIIDRNGNTMTFDYDGLGRLMTIHDTLDTEAHNRDITIAYNSDGFIQSVTDWTGRQVTYEYYDDGDVGGSFGDLKSVTTPAVVGTPNGNDFPGGKTTVYTYTKGFADERLNHDLLTVTDPKGQTWLINEYAHTIDAEDVRHTQDPAEVHFDRIVRQTWGDPGDIYDMFYVPQTPNVDNHLATVKAICNDRMGNVKEFFYDSRNRGVLFREFTGRAPDPDAVTTETLNRPVNPLRPSDPPLFETRYEYNNDSLLTRVTTPNGNIHETTYESDVNPNGTRRLQGNIRQIRDIPGPLGGDQVEIVQSFEYDAGLGGCCGTNFVTRRVDGQGHETLHTYDSNGNRMQTVHRIPSIVEDYEYNEFGQLTAHVLPDNGGGHRRRDEFVYFDGGTQNGFLQSLVIDADGLALTHSYEYDSLGRPTRMVDPRGHDTLYVYNALDQIVRESSREVSPGSGLRYTHDSFYDANDNLVRLDSENIDEEGVQQPNTHFSSLFEYDILNYETMRCREAGSADLGPADLDCAALPAGEFVRIDFTYDANRQLALTRYGEATNGNQPTNTMLTLYDERDLPFQRIRAAGDPEQSTTQFDYDGNGNRTVIREGLEDTPRVTVLEYDGYNRPTRSTDPMGNQTAYDYDANGNRVAERVDGELNDVAGSSGNVRLSETSHVYDPQDRRITTAFAFFDTQTQSDLPGGQQVGQSIALFAYSDNSQVISVTDDNGHAETTVYDTANRRGVVTDAKGNSVAYAYDANSNVVSRTEVDKSDLGNADEVFVSTHSYDGLDRLIETVDNDQNTVQFRYDSRDNLTKVVDSIRPINPTDPGNVTRHTYDGLNRRTATTHILTDDGTGTGNPAGVIVTAQTWDDSSRLTVVADDNGNASAYTYDPLDRRITQTFADGSAHQREYDVHGNRTQLIDPNGTVVDYTYDLLNRLTQRDIAPGPGVSADTTQESYQYDGLSRLVRAEDDDSVVTRQYDSLNGVVQEMLTIAPGGPSETSGIVLATYDGERNRLTSTYPSGRVVTSTYDDLHRVQAIADGAGIIGSFDYVGTCRVERRSIVANNTRTDYAYDNVKRMVGTTHTFDPDGAGTVIDERSYAWDRMSNKTSRADLRPGGPQLVHDYKYDSIYRLRDVNVTDPSQTVVRATTYQLDGVGNRADVIGTPDDGTSVGTYTLASGPPRHDLEMNQYTATPQSGRTYDTRGNLLTIGLGDTASFVACLTGPGSAITVDGCAAFDTNPDLHVDLRDIAEFQRTFVSSTGPAARLTYDYADRMVEYLDIATGQRHTYAYDALGRRIARIADADGVADQTRYFYDGWQVVEEQDGAGASRATYVYGRGIDDVLNMQRDGADRYFHNDDLFSVMAVTDAAGVVVERYDYLDYGQPQITDADGTPLAQSAIGNVYLFTGRRFDPESGLYYYRRRYLDPHAGRFTTRDTIGIWGDEANLGNGYTYGASNPATHTDPMGQEIYCAGVSGFIAAALGISGSAMKCTDDCKQPPDEALVICAGGGFGIGTSWGVGDLKGSGCLSIGVNSQITFQAGLGPASVSVSNYGHNEVAFGGSLSPDPRKYKPRWSLGAAVSLEGCVTEDWPLPF